MLNEIKARKKAAKSYSYPSYATNIRIKDYAVVLCKTDYAEDADPKILEKMIGDALEIYIRIKGCSKESQEAIAKIIAENTKKDVATAAK